MKNTKIKKVLGIGLLTIFSLSLILIVHIYLVYKPKAPGQYSKALARIDLQQSISPSKLGPIESWFHEQKGIDHVLVNPQNHIIIFSFFPIQTGANQIVKNFKEHFNLKAQRYIPSQEELKHSCPVSGSFGYKIYQVISQIL